MNISPKSTNLENLLDSLPATKAGLESKSRLATFGGEHVAAVGLSGGVDSSLCAALLLEAGWRVEGMTLWLMSGKGSCCSEGLIDAAGICKQLKIIHHIVDTRSTFQEEIVEQVIDSYREGITPIPCSRCNRSVKFSKMVEWAQDNRNICRIATGHYARIKYSESYKNTEIKKHKGSARNQLLRGIDKNKDQSYFLYDLTQNILGKIVFPLGELTKEDTRKEAERFGLRTAKKAESQDLCLAEHHGSMKAFIDEYLPAKKGEIVLQDGTLIGEHEGIQHFTIGQRKGLGVSWHHPLHVIKLEPGSNRVIVAPREESGRTSCTIGEVNWVSIEPPNQPIEVEVQVRYRGTPQEAKLIPIEPTKTDIERERPHRCRLIFNKSQFSITPGQAAVFYKDDLLLGGGLIQRY